MKTKTAQRTLVVTLGEAGAAVGDLLLVSLGELFGEAGLVGGLAVLLEETGLSSIKAPVLVAGGTEFDRWQTTFEQRLEQEIFNISQVNTLTRLAQQGLKLAHPDEILLLVIVDMTKSWTLPAIQAVVENARRMVYRQFACHLTAAGVLLQLMPLEAENPDELRQFRPLPICFSDDGRDSDWLSGASEPILFDRGCFVAGSINEAGLIIGHREVAMERIAKFLQLLVANDCFAGVGLADATEQSLTSFGLAWVRWPAQELVGALSRRWARTILDDMFSLSVTIEAGLDPAARARQAAQQWLTAQNLPPLLLIDQLEGKMPYSSADLAEIVPFPPWPWKLAGVQQVLEDATQRRQQGWLANRQAAKNILDELEAGWSQNAREWLHQQLIPHPDGAVVWAQSYLAAVSELLRAMVEGVAQKLEETETDLADLDQQIGQAADALGTTLENFPSSPPAALVRWGWQPLRWPRFALRCRRGEQQARQFAHLLRARLALWKSVWYFEEMLSFYRRLLTGWEQIVKHWNEMCRQVNRARQLPQLAGWATELDDILSNSSGPWTVSLVTGLYHRAVDEFGEQLCRQYGDLNDWVKSSLEADGLAAQLQQAAAGTLEKIFLIPADLALSKQLPTTEEQVTWLAGMLEQARPFWPYDETALAQNARSQAQLKQLLLLPGGADSPLAELAQSSRPPPIVGYSPEMDEVMLVTMRRIGRLFRQDE